MKITQEEKKTIREAAAKIYAAAECDDIYDKQTFFQKLKETLLVTPMVGGYADMSKLIDRL